MSEQRRDSSKPKAEPRKKATETVQLTAEDLKKISGGVLGNPPPPPPVQPDVKLKG